MPDFERTNRYPTDPLRGSRRLVETDLDEELRVAGETLTVHTGGKRIEIGVRSEPESLSSRTRVAGSSRRG